MDTPSDTHTVLITFYDASALTVETVIKEVREVMEDAYRFQKIDVGYVVDDNITD